MSCTMLLLIYRISYRGVKLHFTVSNYLTKNVMHYKQLLFNQYHYVSKVHTTVEEILVAWDIVPNVILGLPSTEERKSGPQFQFYHII